MKINEEGDDLGTLIYYCRNCGNEEKNINLNNLCISTYEQVSSQKTSKINEFTKYDPTLPHSYNIKCPREDCVSNTKDVQSDVIYIRVDDINMKYMYLCVHCNINWIP
jgi:DNA-directed RNA polymerase subunit M/transcription elongation factor TFIIS